MRKIALTSGGYTLVDNDTYEWANQFKWSQLVSHNGQVTWAKRNVKNDQGEYTTSLLHREIMNAMKGEQVDHRDCNGMNNQRSNLRLATRSQQKQNSRKSKGVSKFKGVTLTRKWWQARIQVNGKKIELGCYDTEGKASEAYDKAALFYFGEFARTNK